jgi:hypothetical protein
MGVGEPMNKSRINVHFHIPGNLFAESTLTPFLKGKGEISEKVLLKRKIQTLSPSSMQTCW